MTKTQQLVLPGIAPEVDEAAALFRYGLIAVVSPFA